MTLEVRMESSSDILLKQAGVLWISILDKVAEL